MKPHFLILDYTLGSCCLFIYFHSCVYRVMIGCYYLFQSTISGLCVFVLLLQFSISYYIGGKWDGSKDSYVKVLRCYEIRCTPGSTWMLAWKNCYRENRIICLKPFVFKLAQHKKSTLNKAALEDLQ